MKVESLDQGGTVIPGKLAYITEECHQALGRSQLKSGDVLFSIAGTLGRVGVVPENVLPANTNQALAIIRPKPELNPRFAMLCLSNADLQAELLSKKSGVAQYNLSLKQIGEVQIPLPPLAEQEALVAEVEGYQKVIDGARQVVAHYRPRITIDPTWPMVELGNLIELSSGQFLPAKDMKDGPHAVYGGNGVNGRHNEFTLADPTIVIGRVGAYCGAVHMTEPKSWITDNGLYVKAVKRDIDLSFLQHALTALDLNQYAKIGGQPSISQSTVLNLSIALPPLPEQQRIVAELEEERALVAANHTLVEKMEAKVRERVARVWGK